MLSQWCSSRLFSVGWIFEKISRDTGLAFVWAVQVELFQKKKEERELYKVKKRYFHKDKSFQKIKEKFNKHYGVSDKIWILYCTPKIGELPKPLIPSGKLLPNKANTVTSVGKHIEIWFQVLSTNNKLWRHYASLLETKHW